MTRSGTTLGWAYYLAGLAALFSAVAKGMTYVATTFGAHPTVAIAIGTGCALIAGAVFFSNVQPVPKDKSHE